MSWRDRNWKYADSEETREPGYLARKFKRLQREQAEKAKAERAAKVQPIRKAARCE